jgi:tetratricopeptide (TPR) repeat protein
MCSPRRGRQPIGPDDVEERLARTDELIRLAEEIRDERLAAEGHAWKARYYFEFGDVAAAERETEIQERFAETSRQTFHRYLAALNRTGCALLEGRFDDGEELVRKALETADAGERTNTVVSLYGYNSLLYEQQGRAHELLPAFLSLMEALPQVPMWRAVVAANRVAVGHTEAARRDFEALAAHDFRDIPRDLVWLFILCRLCDVVSFFGDAHRAALLYDLLLPYADRCATPSLAACRGSTSRSLGILATLLSRYDVAERHFENALEMNARNPLQLSARSPAPLGGLTRRASAIRSSQRTASSSENADQALEQDVLEVAATVEEGEDHDFVRPDPVDQPIRPHDQLAPCSHAEAQQLWNDPAPQGIRLEAPCLRLQPTEEALCV